MCSRSAPDWKRHLEFDGISCGCYPVCLELHMGMRAVLYSLLQVIIIGAGFGLGHLFAGDQPAKLLEVFIEYKLYAHSLKMDGLLAFATYGESGEGYVCSNEDIKDSSYDPTISRVEPPSEGRLKSSIFELVRNDKFRLPVFYPDKQNLLVWCDAQGREHPVQTKADWEKRRAHIISSMEAVMGRMPGTNYKVPLDMQVHEESRLDDYTLQKITYSSEKGDRVPAYLLKPHGLSGKAPAMLCLHQTTSLGKAEPVGHGPKTNLHYAHELAKRGYVTLSPDYPNFGEYKIDVYKLGYESATMKGIWNHHRAIDLLSSLPFVDPERIGVIGHSLGGHNAMFVAVFDSRIKAVVVSCGFNSFFKYAGGNICGWSHAGYMPRIASVYNNDARLMPFDFTEVLAALAPRPVFINAPLYDDNFEVSGVRDCIIAALPVYKLYGVVDNLKVLHPACGHDFPPDVRMAAYEWLDRYLKAIGTDSTPK